MDRYMGEVVKTLVLARVKLNTYSQLAPLAPFADRSKKLDKEIEDFIKLVLAVDPDNAGWAIRK